MALEPAINDDEYTLIFKFTKNLWDAAGGSATSIPQPDYGRDDVHALLKKAVNASALL
jgi:hypothetical protein